MTESVIVDDVVHGVEGTRILVRGLEHGAEALAEIRIGAVGPAAVESALDRLGRGLAEGLPWAAAIAEARAQGEIARRCERRRAAEGYLVLDDTASSTAAEVRRSLSVLAELTRPLGSSLAVIGELVSTPQEWFDDHDALGRIIVRLDINQLVVVGQGARHLHNAAGLEGSWDGESVLVDTPDEAYDVVRAQVESGDVVLVTGAALSPLSSLVGRLVGDRA